MTKSDQDGVERLVNVGDAGNPLSGQLKGLGECREIDESAVAPFGIEDAAIEQPVAEELEPIDPAVEPPEVVQRPQDRVEGAAAEQDEGVTADKTDAGFAERSAIAQVVEEDDRVGFVVERRRFVVHRVPLDAEGAAADDSEDAATVDQAHRKRFRAST